MVGVGTIKLGAYKWRWATQSNIDQSNASGAGLLELSFGPLRIIRRFTGDPDYANDFYDTVKPQ